MTPGKVHEYASCTTFSTPSEYMEGHYTFHRLGDCVLFSSSTHTHTHCCVLILMLFLLLANKEEVFQVAIPRFHMVCPPYREPSGQMVKHMTFNVVTGSLSSHYSYILCTSRTFINISHACISVRVHS